jgi:hypothetical protein
MSKRRQVTPPFGIQFAFESGTGICLPYAEGDYTILCGDGHGNDQAAPCSQEKYQEGDDCGEEEENYQTPAEEDEDGAWQTSCQGTSEKSVSIRTARALVLAVEHMAACKFHLFV